MLAQQLNQQVSEAIRQRGNHYWRRGAVDYFAANPTQVEAVVIGTREYAVSLAWQPESRVLEGICTCPDFSDRRHICKHIWATVLTADDRRGLEEVDQAGTVSFQPGHSFEFGGEADWPLDADSEHDDPFDEEDSSSDLSTSTWRTAFAEIGRRGLRLDPSQEPWRGEREIHYLLSLLDSGRRRRIVVEIRCRDRKKNGRWGRLKSVVPDRETVAFLPNAADRQLLSMIIGARDDAHSRWGYQRDQVPRRFVLPHGNAELWIRMAADTGRLSILEMNGELSSPLTWDDGAPWRLQLEITHADETLRLRGFLVRDEASTPAASRTTAESTTGIDARSEGRLDPHPEGGVSAATKLPLSSPVLMSVDGIIVFPGRVARFVHDGGGSWIPTLLREGEVTAHVSETEQFLEMLMSLPQGPKIELPSELAFEEVQGEPVPSLTVEAGASRRFAGDLTRLVLEFSYEGVSIGWADVRPGVVKPKSRRVIYRDHEAETAALDRIKDLGGREVAADFENGSGKTLVASERVLPELVDALVSEGWRVEMGGQRYHEVHPMDLEVTSGIDWFDLRGDVQVGDQVVKLPTLLRALRRGDAYLELGDGNRGILSSRLLDTYEPLIEMGALAEESVRFGHNQIGLIDALLSARPEIDFDESVARARRRLAGFEGIAAQEPPSTFQGTLRDYQQEGLGWLLFLREFGFGGCLADDMGLGKTVQVLALLESVRRDQLAQPASEKGRCAPSLIVVPKSLMFNWQREVERFTPELRVLDFTGPGRTRDISEFAGFDLILTTYGTLRRDIGFLSNMKFEYVVLDEAQAIKNHKSATAKACRLVRASHRLALTGTPMENHVGELMSLLDCLNPGIFGAGRRLAIPRGMRSAALDDSDEQNNQLALLAATVRPFILRRTKAQVASDLPEKFEETLYCELPKSQRKEYDQLRKHYQQTLLGRVENNGLGRSKIHVLEALLRLRQAACHPGLIDADRRHEDSGKLSLLLKQLQEVVSEGHKALVFSQFTSMLAIVRERFDRLGMTYEYLDGKSRKREVSIKRFQEDPECSVFLISLKAGGVGLNLTAADYVFLLDPWWNPAVEAQAIDRTHRIGQTQTVFAYSLIAKDTVEEKVLELQKSKRDLAESIIRADSSLLKSLTREQLAEILS